MIRETYHGTPYPAVSSAPPPTCADCDSACLPSERCCIDGCPTHLCHSHSDSTCPCGCGTVVCWKHRVTVGEESYAPECAKRIVAEQERRLLAGEACQFCGTDLLLRWTRAAGLNVWCDDCALETAASEACRKVVAA